MFGSIFLDFNLPNAATWFYFSLMIMGGLFFRFNRPFALRNIDLLALFLLVPGFLLLQEGHSLLYLAHGSSRDPATVGHLTARGKHFLHAGYLWLITGSGYWFVRCILDLGLERGQSSPVTNLNLPGLAWITAALFLCMIAVAVRRMPDMPVEQVGKGPIALTRVQEGATAVVNYQLGVTDLDNADTAFWVGRAVTMALHLAIMAALVLIGIVHFRNATIGMAAACLYILLPYTAFHVSQVHHVWPAAFLIWAVFTYRQPTLTGVILGMAGGASFSRCCSSRSGSVSIEAGERPALRSGGCLQRC